MKAQLQIHQNKRKVKLKKYLRNWNKIPKRRKIEKTKMNSSLEGLQCANDRRFRNGTETLERAKVP